jgi:hypothetical protein
MLHALKRIFIEDRDNADVLEKVLWLLTNITTYTLRLLRLYPHTPAPLTSVIDDTVMTTRGTRHW